MDVLQPVSSDRRDKAGDGPTHRVAGDHRYCGDLLGVVQSLLTASVSSSNIVSGEDGLSYDE